MFFDQDNIAVRLGKTYVQNFIPANMPVFLQVSSRTLHTLSLRVIGDSATMKVDDLEESHAKFFFSKPNSGYFSLVSNSLIPFQGGYRSLTLSSNGKTVCEIDFTQLSSVDELERYFDCYYFDFLSQEQAPKKTKISNYWRLNDLGYLICSPNASFNIYHQLDAANMCMLTYKNAPLKDFDLTLEFVQSWGRYGVVFGCEQGSFPYYYDAKEHKHVPTEGAFAYVEAEGHRTMRGALIHSAFNKAPRRIVRYDKDTLPTFYASTEGELCSLKKAKLIYHIDAEGSYVCPNKVIPLGPGHLTYLPPFTKYQPSSAPDRHIYVEFDVLYGDCPYPDYTVPKNPDKIQLLFEKLLLLQSNPSINAKYQSYTVFYQILAEAQNRVTSDDSIPALIRPSFEYMNKNFSNPKLTIADIAKVSNISEVYFRQIFKKTTGQLPNKYILNLRINHASFLLQSSKYKVTEIATKSGFSDIKYFMTVFKKVTGFSPQKYRQLHN